MYVLQFIIVVIGEVGEDCVLCYLQVCGLVVVSCNYCCKGGEIDLVMCDVVGVLVFVEVCVCVVCFMQCFGGVVVSVMFVKQWCLIVVVEDFFVWQVEDVLVCCFDVIVIDGVCIEWMCDVFGVDV